MSDEGYTDEQGVFHPFTNKSSNSVAGAAAAVVLAALAGGGAGTAAAASGAADEFSAGTRTTQNQEADDFSINAKTSRGKAEIRIAGDEDSIRVTTRLRRAGGHPTKLDARSSKKDCADHSDGDVQSFFRKHECATLYRTLIEYKDGNYVIRFLIATVEMPDDGTAADLHSLLLSDHTGDITPLSSEGKNYTYVSFTSGLTTTTLRDTVVTNTRTQAVGSTPRAEALGFLTTSLLFGLR